MKKSQISLSAFMLILALSKIASAANFDGTPQWTIQNHTQKYIEYYIPTSSAFIHIPPKMVFHHLVLTDKQGGQIAVRYKDQVQSRKAVEVCSLFIYPNRSQLPSVTKAINNDGISCQVSVENDGDYRLTISDSKAN